MRPLLEIQKIEHSDEIVWAGMMALYLAINRKRRNIGMEEYFAGVYLVGRYALAPYWVNGGSLDEFARDVCGLTGPAWLYWIEFHEALKTKHLEGTLGLYSKELAGVLNHAARLAMHSKRDGRKKRLLKVEHLMAALAARPNLKFTRRMLASGAHLPGQMKVPTVPFQ